MNKNSNILYYDNIMIPDRNAIFTSSLVREDFESFDNLLNNIDITKINTGFIDINIFNKVITRYDVLKQSDLDSLKGKTIKEVKDELCKKAMLRKIFISPNKTEVYGEAFLLRGEMNYKHYFLFDYDVLYLNADDICLCPFIRVHI